jgi:hypothetical protein
VTGIDVVEKALGRARQRVEREGVEMRLARGDVTALRETGVHLSLTATFGFRDDLRVPCRGPSGYEAAL